MTDMTDTWSVEELRHQVGASEHMLALTRREYAADPTPERQGAVEEAALWLGRFRDLLSDRLQFERRMKEQEAMNVSDQIQQQANKLQRHIDYGELDRVRAELGKLAMMTRRIERALDEVVADAMEDVALPVPVPPVAQIIQFPTRIPVEARP